MCEVSCQERYINARVAFLGCNLQCKLAICKLFNDNTHTRCLEDDLFSNLD